MCPLSFSASSNGSLNSSSVGGLSLRWKLTSLLLVLACLILTGCSNPLHGFLDRTPDLYVPAGKCAEIRKPVTVYTWSHDEKGQPVKSHYHAYAGSNIGPGIPSSAVPPGKESAVK